MSTAIEKETQPVPTAAAEKDRAMFTGEKDPAMIVSFAFPVSSSARRAPVSAPRPTLYTWSCASDMLTNLVRPLARTRRAKQLTLSSRAAFK